jgi:hypothetical protein
MRTIAGCVCALLLPLVVACDPPPAPIAEPEAPAAVEAEATFLSPDPKLAKAKAGPGWPQATQRRPACALAPTPAEATGVS